MMETINLPTETDIRVINTQIQDAKRSAEYEELEQELHDVTYKASHMSTEFDGQMQLPYIHQVLKSRHRKLHFFDILFARIHAMFSLRPVTGNIIALLIAGIALFYIFNEANMAGFEKYQNYFAIGVQIVAAIQIIKSATRSLLLPFVGLVIGTAVAHSLGAPHSTLLHFNREFYQHLTMVSIIGICVAVLAID